MAWVIDNSQQTGHGFVALLMIANHANAEGKKSFPSMKTLAKECRLSVRTIQRVILKQRTAASFKWTGAADDPATLTRFRLCLT
jgi:hypothetical protein